MVPFNIKPNMRNTIEKEGSPYSGVVNDSFHMLYHSQTLFSPFTGEPSLLSSAQVFRGRKVKS